MQFIPSAWEDCLTVPLQIAWLKYYIDQVAEGAEAPDITQLKAQVEALDANMANVETEINYIKTVLDTHQDAINQANTNAHNALDTANSAHTTADSATAIANQANTTANQANTTATEAKTTAETAATNASQAEAIANAAKSSVDTNTANIAALTNKVTQNTTQTQKNTSDISDLQISLANKQDNLTFDAYPTAGSNNPVTSDGIAKAISASGGGGSGSGSVDSVVTPDGKNAVNGIAVTNYVTGIVEPIQTDLGNVESLAGTLKRENIGIHNDIDLINENLAKKQNTLTFDTTPALGSNNPVTSSGIYTDTRNAIKNSITDQMTEGSTQAITSGNVYNQVEALRSMDNTIMERVNSHTEDISALTTAVQGLDRNKQNKLTFDSTPTADSQNPVTSDGIKKAIDAIPGSTVDQEVTATSTNAVSSKAVYDYVSTHTPDITVDENVTQGSPNPVSGGGVYLYAEEMRGDIADEVANLLENKQDKLIFDQTPTAGSTNPVTSSGIKSYVDTTATVPIDPTGPSENSNSFVTSGQIYTALQAKQNTLTFDQTPTAGSTNPVTSAGIKEYVDGRSSQMITLALTVNGGKVTHLYDSNYAEVDISEAQVNNVTISGAKSISVPDWYKTSGMAIVIPVQFGLMVSGNITIGFGCFAIYYDTTNNNWLTSTIVNKIPLTDNYRLAEIVGSIAVTEG